MVHVLDHSKASPHRIIPVTKTHGDTFGGLVFTYKIIYTQNIKHIQCFPYKKETLAPKFSESYHHLHACLIHPYVNKQKFKILLTNTNYYFFSCLLLFGRICIIKVQGTTHVTYGNIKVKL